MGPRSQEQLRRRWTRRLEPVVAVLTLVTACLSGGCTSARNTLGTNAAACVQALPVAARAVHHRGSFDGVILVDEGRLGQPDQTALRAVLDQRAGRRVTTVCLVSYSGEFRLSQVDLPTGSAPPGGTGHYAIVVVSPRGVQLLATFVLSTQPLGFRHNHLGP